MVKQQNPWRLALGVCALLLAPAMSGPAGAQTANPDDVTYLLPFWWDYRSATDAEVQAEIPYMRTHIGEGAYFKVGFTTTS